MSRVTSKLQVTIPKRIAEEFRIAPGDEVRWVSAGDAIRVVPDRAAAPTLDVSARLKLFDAATGRQVAREGASTPRAARHRGWRRDDLYSRGRAR